MNGQVMDYKKYYEALGSMPGPVSLEEMPKVRFDFRGIIQYAKDKGVDPNDLTEEERERFITRLDK